jgi:hypothetical protein
MRISRFNFGPNRVSGVVLLVVLGFFLWSTPATATKYAGAFMENGGGARALAMGGAFHAVANDPSAVFWNPAGLSLTQQHNILLMHSERFGDLIDRDFVAYTQPVGWSILGGEEAGIGLSLIRLGIDDIPFTEHIDLDSNGDGVVDDNEILQLLEPEFRNQISFKSDQELAFFISYGERKGKWQFGGSLKVVRQSIGDYSSLGIGFDLGLLRPGLWKRLDFGIKFQDLTTTYLSWSTGKNEIITPAIIPAFAYTFPLTSWNAAFLLSTSLETRFDNRRDSDQYWIGSSSANVLLGGEFSFNDKVFLRGGFAGGWSDDALTAGAGFRIRPLTIDYAYAGRHPAIDEVTHRISLTVSF